MRRRGGGVGAEQTMPAGRPLEPFGVGVGAGVAEGLTPPGVGFPVGVAGLDPHCARTVAAPIQAAAATMCRVLIGTSQDPFRINVTISLEI
jgi:hypothetical protein